MPTVVSSRERDIEVSNGNAEFFLCTRSVTEPFLPLAFTVFAIEKRCVKIKSSGRSRHLAGSG